MIVNVHERVLAAPVDEVGRLLDGMGGPDDRIWPSPQWVPLRLDGPVAVGARGGQGGADHFVVEAHEPGRRVDLGLNPRIGLRGTASLVAEPLGPDTTLLRHDTRARPAGAMRLVWPLFLRWMHDACVEALLDRAQEAVGDPPAHPARHPPLVRVLRPLTEREPVREVPVPRTALLAGGLPRVDRADAHAVARPRGSTADPQAWADAIFHGPAPAWWAALIRVRDALVGPLGFVRSDADPFATVAAAPDEVLVGGGDRHLTFRASVLVEADRVVLTSIVHLRDAAGRAYLAPVWRVHPLVVRSLLSRAAGRLSEAAPPWPGRAGWGTKEP